MNNAQLNQQSMQRTAVAVLTTLPEGSYPLGLAARMAELRTKQREADDLVAQQQMPLRAAVDERDQALNAMLDATVLAVGLALGHARANGPGTIASRLQFRLAAVQRQRLERRVQLCRQVADAVRDELPALAGSGLTAAMIDDLDAKAAAAEVALVAPRDTVVTKRAATERLPVVLREIGEILRTGVDPLVYTLRHTQPDFYARYRAAREIVSRSGSRGARAEAEGVDVPLALQPAATTQTQPLAA